MLFEPLYTLQITNEHDQCLHTDSESSKTKFYMRAYTYRYYLVHVHVRPYSYYP